MAATNTFAWWRTTVRATRSASVSCCTSDAKTCWPPTWTRWCACCRPTNRILSQPLSERVFPLVANRLTRPGSEHALAQWLEDFYVVTSQGSRWMPRWKASRRVKVSFEQLRLWYETLDDLLAHKAQIETAIWQQLRNLFSLEPELVFYDITSTYFEGQGPAELGRFGYSRDGKPRNRQVLIGVGMMDGWPIAHHVFAGNRLDQTTVGEVVADLHQRFGWRRVVFVGDRGMVTLKNVEQLRQNGQGYLVGLQRRNRKDIPHYIEQAVAPRTRVREVAGKEPGVRVFVVHSEEREQYERGMRELFGGGAGVPAGPGLREEVAGRRQQSFLTGCLAGVGDRAVCHGQSG
jgi:hypothetical protein